MQNWGPDPFSTCTHLRAPGQLRQDFDAPLAGVKSLFTWVEQAGVELLSVSDTSCLILDETRDSATLCRTEEDFGK